ncbi:hypothetical protein C8J57DRAFT_1240121 [Mycena rebaudengoi]|nr:hypothetical protein C8J57DRAFT_1240121 [Mycena rebaudengoi]
MHSMVQLLATAFLPVGALLRIRWRPVPREKKHVRSASSDAELPWDMPLLRSSMLHKVGKSACGSFRVNSTLWAGSRVVVEILVQWIKNEGRSRMCKTIYRRPKVQSDPPNSFSSLMTHVMSPPLHIIPQNQFNQNIPPIALSGPHSNAQPRLQKDHRENDMFGHPEWEEQVDRSARC